MPQKYSKNTDLRYRHPSVFQLVQVYLDLTHRCIKQNLQ